MTLLRRISTFSIKTVTCILLSALLAVTATSVSLVYDFREPRPFSGPDIFNPYHDIDSAYCWKRASFHNHTRVEGLMNECEKWPGEVLADLEKFGYDIVTFSNHNELTVHPSDPALQVNVYEHGYNLLKYHKLVFGCDKVNHFDHLLPIFPFQRQFQLDLLGKDSDFIQINHPLRTPGSGKALMQKLSGYQIMELDSGKSTENEYWDSALSAGHYSFALANDDLHYPDRPDRIAVRCNFLCCPSASYEDIKSTLLEGCYYSMRIPDYGHGDWSMKIARNRSLPEITDIGMRGNTIYMTLSATADSIKVTGQDHSTLLKESGSDKVAYTMKPEDSYARLTAWFPEGEVIYTNPFARYDASRVQDPFDNEPQKVNIFMTILYNLLLLAVCVFLCVLIYKIAKK